MENLGFIGFGEAASNFACGIFQQKPELCLFAYDALGIENTVKNLNLNVHISNSLEELLKSADNVIVAIPGKYDLEMFKSINASIFKNKLIMDICTAKPADKLEISRIVDGADGCYVDVAAMGSFPALKHKVPLLISGRGVEIMQKEFDGLEMNIKKVGEKAGDAMVVKLCRSIYMKGIAALTIEMTEVCEAYGVKNEVWSSLAESMDNDQFMVYSQRLINGTLRNLQRRTTEVEECIDLIKSAGKTAFMTEATRQLYTQLSKL